MGQRAMGMSGDPEQDFARRRLLAVLGANMMGSPHPGAIGQGMHQGVLAGVDARQEYQERIRQQRQDSWREEDANWQRSERERAARERNEQDASMRAEGERLTQARARLREAGDVNADFYSAKQVDEQYTKRFGYQEPDEEKWQIREGGDGRTYRVNPMTGEVDDLEDIPADVDEINWQMHTNADGSVVQVNPRTGTFRPVRGLTGRSSETASESTLTPNKVTELIQQRIEDGKARGEREALQQIQLIYPASALPPSFRPKTSAGPPASPRPAPAASAGRRTGIGASAAKAPEMVTYGGQKVPLQELVEAIRDEPSPSAALQGLISRGVPAETAKLIVSLAFSGPVASKQLTP